jgi:hypothetical protein
MDTAINSAIGSFHWIRIVALTVHSRFDVSEFFFDFAEVSKHTCIFTQ